ncbi:MAG: hypothetical protein H2048_02425 [Erythrobacter sp.]|nr:hypothetical protein [Erythrobacter sp.]
MPPLGGLSVVQAILIFRAPPTDDDFAGYGRGVLIFLAIFVIIIRLDRRLDEDIDTLRRARTLWLERLLGTDRYREGA